MVSFLNALDPNVARRRLRDTLVESAEVLGAEPEDIPHSFDTGDLLAFAKRHATARVLDRHPGTRLDLLAKTGVALALSGKDADAERLLERGYRSAATNQQKAEYLYYIGYHSEHRRGDAHRARETLNRAYVLSERRRRLRGEILLALGTIEANVGNLDSAERSLESSLELSLRDLEPHALLRLSDVATLRGEFDVAVELNRKSHAHFSDRDDWQGRKIADSNLAVLRIERGELDAAEALLESVIGQGLRVLDVARLGRDFNNRAVLRSQQGDAAGARNAVLEAIRYHGAAGRRSLLIGNYQNLGGYLLQLRQTGAALAAFETATDLARELALVHREFQVLAHLLLVAALEGVPLASLADVVSRCERIMETHAESVSKKSVISFARAMQRHAAGGNRFEPKVDSADGCPRLADAGGRAALERLVPPPQASDFAALLRCRIGDGLPGRDAPPIGELTRFLMQFLGGFFKSGTYTREFSITQERAKRHLKWMCAEGLIERQGARKASCYSLAFHRS